MTVGHVYFFNLFLLLIDDKFKFFSVFSSIYLPFSTFSYLSFFLIGYIWCSISLNCSIRFSSISYLSLYYFYLLLACVGQWKYFDLLVSAFVCFLGSEDEDFGDKLLLLCNNFTKFGFWFLFSFSLWVCPTIFCNKLLKS